MKESPAPTRKALASWRPDALLALALMLIYASTYTTDYLMQDELARVGVGERDAMEVGFKTFLGQGRFIAGFGVASAFEFAGISPFRIRLLRWLCVLGFALIAIAVRRVARRSWNGDWRSTTLVLLFFTQLPTQAAIGCGAVFLVAYLPAAALSLLALGIVHWESAPRWLPPGARAAAALVVLLMAMQANQSYAVFAVVPLLVPTLALWPASKRRTLTFLGACLAALILSGVAYKAAMGQSHISGYAVGEAAIGAITQQPFEVAKTAINPATYWSAFRFWSFPFPLDRIANLGSKERSAALVVMGLWVLLIGSAVALEWSAAEPAARREVAFKWLAALACLGFGAFPIVADSPFRDVEHRPHIPFVLVGVILFMAAHALKVLAGMAPILAGAWGQGAALALLAFFACGAQAGVERNIVTLNADRLAFIRQSLTVDHPVKAIVVVLPQRNGCPHEPCNNWMGFLAPDKNHLRAMNGYRYALATVHGGSDFSVPVVFLNPKKAESAALPEGAAVVDWDRYVLTRARVYWARPNEQLDPYR